ncbi:MAG: hypothetical protein IIX99_05165, partial [Oscillospiraceae bacterium]|nr:hypothetical protein [Oscillospiraceae bacterium]
EERVCPSRRILFLLRRSRGSSNELWHCYCRLSILFFVNATPIAASAAKQAFCVSKTLAQGGFTSPEQVKSPLGWSAAMRHGTQNKKHDFRRAFYFGGLEGDRFSAEKPRRLRCATGTSLRAAFRSPSRKDRTKKTTVF